MKSILRKDTFDETMKRIEAMMAASEARTEKQIAEIRQQVSGMENLLLVVVDQLNSKQNKAMGLLACVIATAAVIIAAVQVFIAVFR